MAGPTREEARLAQVMQEAFDKIANRMDRMERGMKSTADSAKKISDYSSKSLDDIEKTISAEQNRAAVMQSIAETEVSNFQRRAEAFLAASEAQLRFAISI
jgi:gamma-glutamylcysteine synthetase